MNFKYLKLWRELDNADHDGPDSVIEDLKDILFAWEEKEYSSDKDRWQSYARDIAALVNYYGSEAGWKKKKSKKYKQ